MLTDEQLEEQDESVKRFIIMFNNRRKQLNHDIDDSNRFGSYETKLQMRGRVKEFEAITDLLVASGLVLTKFAEY